MHWRWFRREKSDESNLAPQVENLRGAPTHARIKTYSAQSGYVYQYVFRGYCHKDGSTSKEFVFEVQQSLAPPVNVRVQLDETELRACSNRIERSLLPAEQYAVAKLTLFSGFDEADGPEHFALPMRPTAEVMFTHLHTLGRT